MIGICISTTPARRELFSKVYAEWEKYKPDGAILTYVCDENSAGVARTKNASLKLLESLGATHYFLVDDDTFPIHPDWYKPFVESPENHLLYNFKLEGKPKNDMKEVYCDGKITAYTHTRGCFIYVTQKVLDTVGGFDTRFYNSLEHPEYSNRIHNAGLTTFRSMSPINAHDLLYCLDQDSRIESSIKDARPDYKLYNRQRKTKEYRAYK